jgi:CHAT domain-containing protein/Tfp pilus assembly protein PilF
MFPTQNTVNRWKQFITPRHKWFSEKEQRAMSYMPTSIPFANRVILTALSLMVWLAASTVFGQVQLSNEVLELPPNQTLEREMTGAETHRYKVNVQKGEFFQVRVEQKGVDVILVILDTSGNVIAAMNSPNDRQGPETLSLVAEQSGSFVLKVKGVDAQAEKGSYTIKREAPRAPTAKDKRRAEVERLFVAGSIGRDTKDQTEIAINQLLEAQAGWQELADSYMAELTVRQLKRLKANAAYVEAGLLMKEGTAESFRAALAKLQEASHLYRESGDKSGEAQSLVKAGYISNALGENAAAIRFLEEAVSLFQHLADKIWEANTLSNIGLVYSDLDEHQEALVYLNRALSLQKAIGDKSGEAATLNNIGLVYSDLGEYQEALVYRKQALPLYIVVGDKSGEAVTLSNIGRVYFGLGEYQKALVHLNRALPLWRYIGDKGGEASTLRNIGAVYSNSGGIQKSLVYFNQALVLYRAISNRQGEAFALNDIGAVYSNLGEHQKALVHLNQALPLWRGVGDKRGEAWTLYDIGAVYSVLGEHQKALYYYSQALPLQSDVGDKGGEAVMLSMIMIAWESLNNRRMAVFYGKQSVNKLQKLRGAVQGLDSETQRSFLRSVQISYQLLIELLIKQGQLDEAVQVMNLYQDQQFFDFNRDANSLVRQIALSSREQEFADRYKNTIDKVGQIGAHIAESKQLIGNRLPNEQESEQLQRLDAELRIATEEFFAVLKDAEKEFAKVPDEKDRVSAVPDVTEMQTALRELGMATIQQPVALYTLIGADKFYILLIPPAGKVKGFESSIKAVDLNKKILRFYDLLKSSAHDPRPLSKELYDIIFKPVEAELKKTNAQTLMWSLDGSLRYVPMAALWNGEKYLVERFQNIAFTRADRERLTRNVSRSWTGTGFGSSQAQTVDLLGDGTKSRFPALPGVTQELQSIFRTDDKDAGIMSGEVFSDTKFTKSAFYEAMKRHRPVVHISSHFSFRPGDDSRSFLLLGDGTALTLKEMKKQEMLFEGVELLALSACNTAATQSDASGKEIDGFAELAQRLGAGAVMASLWAVADKSTALLMSEFYRLRKENPRLTKAAALQLAQQEMIEGKLRPLTTAGQKRDTGEIAGSETGAPTYAYDPKKPYAHPYYWSPFILIGNWR